MIARLCVQTCPTDCAAGVVCFTHARNRGRGYHPFFWLALLLVFTTWGSLCSWAVLGQGWAVAWAVHGLQSQLAGGG